MAVLVEWPILLTGVAWTLALTVAAMLAGTMLGIGCAWVRARDFGSRLAPLWLRITVDAYVELIRNTPFIVQLFFIFFGLPALGVKLSAETSSFIAMVINLGLLSAGRPVNIARITTAYGRERNARGGTPSSASNWLCSAVS